MMNTLSGKSIFAMHMKSEQFACSLNYIYTKHFVLFFFSHISLTLSGGCIKYNHLFSEMQISSCASLIFHTYRHTHICTYTRRIYIYIHIYMYRSLCDKESFFHGTQTDCANITFSDYRSIYVCKYISCNTKNLSRHMDHSFTLHKI